MGTGSKLIQLYSSNTQFSVGLHQQADTQLSHIHILKIPHIKPRVVNQEYSPGMGERRASPQTPRSQSQQVVDN